jgi:hypothetical protein
MEVQGRQAGEPLRSRQVFENEQRALIEANRDRVREARDDLHALANERLSRLRAAREQAVAEERARQDAASERRDRIELSAEARALSETESREAREPRDTEAAAEPETEQRVVELRAARDAGKLHTSARIELAAQRLLGG